MMVATHRVVGVLEWPAGAEPASHVLDTASDDVRLADRGPADRILSLRLPLAEDPALVLTADVSQLRRDLQRLFEEHAG